MLERSGERRHAAANPLAIPLIAVSVIAVLEGVLLAVVLLRDRAPVAAPVTLQAPTPPTPARVADASPAVVPAPTPAATAPLPEQAAARGKVGERVESGGFGITVEKIIHEPQTFKDQVRIGANERYVGLLLLVDNKTGGNATLYPSQFVLRDAAGYQYDRLSLHGTMPALEWQTLGNRENVRGYVDFVVPDSAKGLTLVYGDTSGTKSQPIRVELGQ